MAEINSYQDLKEAIMQLESKRTLEEMDLREQVRLTYESLKPINLIKNTYEEVLASQDLKESLINTSVGLTAGYLSKTLFEGASHSPIRKLLGTALLFGITNVIRKNPEAIKSLASAIFNAIRGMTKSSVPAHNANAI